MLLNIKNKPSSFICKDCNYDEFGNFGMLIKRRLSEVSLIMAIKN